MAQDSHPAELNLEQILATLANLPQTATTNVHSQQQQQNQSQFASQVDVTYPGTPHPAQPTATLHGHLYGHEQPRDPRPSARPSIPSRPQIQQHPPNPRVSTPNIDPATITEWKHGLRCIHKTAAQNPAFIPTVRKLMQDQKRNVKDWESGRQRLIQEQAIKRDNEQEHLAVLSLPGIGEKIAPLRTDEAEKKELEQYDQKVYRACRQMVDSQTMALKGLGVPFFGTRADMMRSESSEGAGVKTTDLENKKITKKELFELQRKMLNHLMELYGD